MPPSAAMPMVIERINAELLAYVTRLEQENAELRSVVAALKVSYEQRGEVITLLARQGKDPR